MNTLKILAIAFSTIIIFGCAASPMPYVDALVHHNGFHGVNGIFHDDRSDRIGSIAAVSGAPRERVDLEELVPREALDLGSVSINILTLHEHTSSTEERILAAVSKGSELRAALSDALIQTIDPMTNVVSQGLQIDLIIVPNKSGRFITLISDRATRPLPLAFLSPVFPEHELGGNSVWSFWLQQAAMISHELLHLEHALAGLKANSRLERIDEETAATLINWCTEARFSQAANSRSIEVAVRHVGLPSARNFPGIFRGEFSPDEERLQSAGHPSSVGNEVARAIVFHLAADGETSIDLKDPEKTAQLYALCDKLPASRPRFTRGEIP